MTDLVVDVRRGDDTGTILCGLRNLRDAAGYERWRDFVKTFLVELCNERTTSLTLQTLEQYDWYSEFCMAEQIPFEVQHLSDEVRIAIRPIGNHQISKVLDALVQDEVWDRDGFLEIGVGNSVVRPHTDGKWFEWLGPKEELAAVEMALKFSAQKHPVQLTWNDI